MYCITRNNPQINILMNEFGEAKITDLSNKHFPDGVPATYDELYTKIKKDLGVIPKSKAKEEVGFSVSRPFIDSRELSKLRALVSKKNNENVKNGIAVVYRTVNNIRAIGGADLIKWDVQKVNKSLNLSDKIDRAKQRLDSSQSQSPITRLQELRPKTDDRGQGLLFNLATAQQSPEISYQLKAISIVSNNLSKIQQWEKQIKDPDTFWNKIQKDLQVPLAQIELLRNSEGSSIEEKLLSFSANYSFSVESNVSTDKLNNIRNYNDDDFQPLIEGDPLPPTSYYSQMTVPGGTNYTENEISTPLITPSIKGHAQFSTDKGIGWYRADEQDYKIDTNLRDYTVEEFWNLPEEQRKKISASHQAEQIAHKGKVRRILEVQSDLFQKGRDDKFLDSELSESFNVHKRWYQNDGEDFDKNSSENQFLQLLNKDNNWVSFFVKSIIQDSAKKGYEKVLFPKGDTAAKVEGHQTIEDFIKNKETRVNKLKVEYKEFIAFPKNIKLFNGTVNNSVNRIRLNEFKTEEEAKEYVYYTNNNLREEYWAYKKNDSKDNDKINEEIKQLEKEIKEAKEGKLKISAIHSFYENNIHNILKKNYNVQTITDEYGNTWYEIAIEPSRDMSTILFQQENSYQTKAQQETIEKLKDALASLGATVETTNSILEEFGANAVVDLADKLIRIAEGKEQVALAEEAMHLLTALLPKQMLEGLMKDVKNYKMYQLTFDQYSKHPAYQNEDGSPNEEKIKFEAVGKILAEYYIMQAEGLSKEEVALAKTTWASIVDWIKRMFGNKANKFYNIIDGLNRGTLQLADSPSRRDRLLQIAFTRANAENLTDALFINNIKTVNNRAERAVNGMIELTKNIDASDIKVINEAMSHIKANNSTFKTSNAKLERFKSVAELKEKVLQSLEYIRSIGNNIDTLSSRSKELRTLLEEKKNEEGVELTEKELKFASIELSNINTIASIYIDELKNYVDLFHERTETFGLTDALSSAKSQAERIIALNDAIGEEYLEAALDKFLEEKRKGFIRERNRELLHYNNRLKNSPSPKEREFIEEKIKIIEDRIKNHGINGSEMIKMMKSKKTSVLGVISHYMEPSLMHKDEAIQTVANLILDAAKEAYDAAHATIDEYDRIFDKLGAKPTDISKFYEKFVEVVDRKEFNDKNGELKEWKESRLISEYNQYQFENDIAQLKHEIFLAQEEGDKALEKQKIDELSTLYKESGVRRYTDKYYELTDILDTPLENPTDDIKTVRDARNEVIEELSLANEEMDDAVDVISKINAHNKVDEALRKLQTLSSIYNIDGSLKKGDAKLIADTIAQFKENKREHELDNWFMTHGRQAQWEEEKDDIDRRYAKALDEEDFEKIEEMEKERDVWYSINTVQNILPEYYERREDISTKIADLLDKVKKKDAEAQERLDDLYYELSELTKGYKDSDRTIIGEDFNKSQVSKIKEIESEMRRIREIANESSDKMKREDKRLLRKLFKELDALQSTILTPSWERTWEREKMRIMMRMPKGYSVQEFNEALQNSAFIKENTFDVTEKYRHTAGGLPESVVRIGNRIVAPIYIWRKVMPREEWIDDVTPSLRWMNYSVNKDFVNKDQKNLMGKVKIDPSKEQPNKYINDKYKELKKNPKDVEFIEALRERYHKDQMLKAAYERRGDALPTIQANGLQRTLQRFRNLSGVDWSGMKSWAYWKDKFYNLLGLDATTLETVFGEGDVIEPYTVDKGFIQSRNKFKVQVKNKFAQKDFNVNRQDRDLFKILSMYAVEANRSAKMKEIAPLLSTVKRISPVETGSKVFGQDLIHRRTQRMNYEIERQVNRQTKLDKGLSRIAANVSGFAMSSIAFQRIGLPHMISSSVKNSMNGAWQLFNSKGYLTEYSEESLMKAYFTAIPKAFELAAKNFHKDPGIYFAVARRINAISSLNIHDRVGLQKSTALLIADNLKYIAGSQRRVSEIHQELVLFELLRGNKIAIKDKDGNHIEVDILDMYTYKNGELTPKEGLTPEIENSFRNKINEMHTMAQGNFNPEDAIYLKAFWWGRTLAFMKGFVYNPFIRRFGGTRRFITGVEQRGMYRVMYDILSTHPKDIFKASNLTNNEKAGLYGFLKDFFMVNAIGLLTYWAEAMASEGDDDDEDKWFNWYIIMMLRKLYGEIGYFNFLDTAVTGANLLFNDDNKTYSRGNQIDNLFTYAIGRPGEDMIKSAIIPFDVRGLKFDRDIEGKVPDPFYSQYDDNVLLYDFMRTVRAKPEFFYGKSALSTYQYYNQSMFNYTKPETEDEK